MEEKKLVKFEIDQKKFQFKIEAEQEVVDSTIDIINEVNNFVKIQRKGMSGIENFGYIIFVLASNLAKKQHQQKENNNFIGNSEQEAEEKIAEMIRKVANWSEM